MPITDPKTPFHEEESDEEMGQEGGDDQAEIDPELAEHLAEAHANRDANATCTSGVRRSQQPGTGPAQQQLPAGGIDPNALANRLEEAKNPAQDDSDEEAKAEASKSLDELMSPGACLMTISPLLYCREESFPRQDERPLQG